MEKRKKNKAFKLAWKALFFFLDIGRKPETRKYEVFTSLQFAINGKEEEKQGVQACLKSIYATAVRN